MFKFIELSTLKLPSDDSNKTNKRPPSEGWRLRRGVHFQSALGAGEMAQGVNVPDNVRPIGGTPVVGDNRLLYVVFSPPRLLCGIHTCTHALTVNKQCKTPFIQIQQASKNTCTPRLPMALPLGAPGVI